MFNWKHREDRRRAQQGSQEGPSQQKTLHQEKTVAEDTCRTVLGPNTEHSIRSSHSRMEEGEGLRRPQVRRSAKIEFSFRIQPYNRSASQLGHVVRSPARSCGS